jgi:hypothetical protein
MQKLFFLAISLFVLQLSAVASAKEVYIDTPTLCCEIRKVDGNKVHIETKPGDCPRGEGKMRVAVEDAVQNLEVYLDGRFWQSQSLQVGFDMDHVNALMEKAKKAKLPKDITKSSFSKQGRVQTEETYRYHQSDEFQEKLAVERKRLEENVFALSQQVPYYKHYKGAKARGKGRILSVSERVYIFISKSVSFRQTCVKT